MSFTTLILRVTLFAIAFLYGLLMGGVILKALLFAGTISFSAWLVGEILCWAIYGK
jgi:hypothetical protein